MHGSEVTQSLRLCRRHRCCCNAAAGEPQGPSLQERLAQAEACIGSLRKTAAPSNTSSSGDDGNSSAGKPPPLLRGPALAAVELAKRKLQLGLGTQQVLADALLAHHDQ